MFLLIYYTSESKGSNDQPITLLQMEDHESIDLDHLPKLLLLLLLLILLLLLLVG